MPHSTKPPSSVDSASVSGPDLKATRRRLLQGGLAAAPVLMTLVSRPVLALQVQTPSAFCSGNASTPDRGLTSSGQSPAYWKQPQNFGAWQPPYYPGKEAGAQPLLAGLSTTGGAGGSQPTLFDSVFTPHYRGKTLLDVLELGGGPPNDVAHYAVAVLLNIAAGWTPVITVKVVKEIWSEYITKGYFDPTAGIHWDEAQIVQYFKSMTSGSG
jgi:hypothetical protein